jgi:hypothetical protein
MTRRPEIDVEVEVDVDVEVTDTVYLVIHSILIRRNCRINGILVAGLKKMRDGKANDPLPGLITVLPSSKIVHNLETKEYSNGEYFRRGK